MKKIFLILFVCCLSLSIQSKDLSDTFVDLAKKVRPSVVNISITQAGFNQMIELIPGYPLPFNQPEKKGSGSGFIVSKEGLIITNSHVVKGFDKIQVQFVDEDTLYPAKVLGSDSHSDIALLKVDVKKALKPIPLGNSSLLEVGEWVVAIGNPHNYGHTMTKGIISAVKREIDELNLYPLLQTDASINPGNSGGPLVNLKGEVVGVNQATLTGAFGISFAIPINNVKEVLEDLKNYGYVRKAFIGVNFSSYNSSGEQGVIVKNVVVQSPAQKAGIQVGDLIIEFNNNKIRKSTDLPKQVLKAKIGEESSLKVVRNGKTLKLKIVPQLFEGNKFIASSVKKDHTPIQGQDVLGSFTIIDPTDAQLNSLGIPSWFKYPIILKIKNKSSLAFKAGLREKDMFYKINGAKVLQAKDVIRTLKKGKSYDLELLRYDSRFDRYRIILIKLKL
ncbi:MAG: trypsin-like peptidase domain-containing protein [Bdellovibrionales bacterium]|nr:trypsin-like peptidase domain-containing protein [Bdellovibrionales bacterium]